MIHVLLTSMALALVPNSGVTISRMVAQNRAAVVGQKISRTREVSMALPRVVVTGMGIVSPLGTTLDEVKTALYECNPGITYCEEFAEVGMKSKVSGMPTFDWCAHSRQEPVTTCHMCACLPRDVLGCARAHRTVTR